MLKQLAPPQNWAQFEQLCRDLWAELLADTETKMHGRRGQAQCGVDVYGTDIRSGTNALVGIQCKGKDNFLSKQVTEAELRIEVANSQAFRPRLNKFILATTALRDAHVQSFTRSVNEEYTRTSSLSVATWSWPDLSEAIQNYPLLLKRYYPENFLEPNLLREADAITLKLLMGPDHEDKLAGLFELDALRSEMKEGFRFEVRDLVLELASNAYRHGSARTLEVKVESKCITIADDGECFDMLAALRELPSEPGMQGLRYIAYFLDRYSSELRLSQHRDNEMAKTFTKLDFEQPFVAILTNSCELLFYEQVFLGRDAAAVEGARLRLAPECMTYIMHLDRKCFMMSSLYRYLLPIVERIPAGKKLVLYVPDPNHRPMMESWFDPAVVEIVCG
jgi:anti-sigma regulatory factor (Ser/Thr protein kinase)